MAKRKNIGKANQMPENYDFSYRANGMQRALDSLQKATTEQDKIYAIYEIAQYCGLGYENPDLFAQQSTPNQIVTLHNFFIQVLTPSLQFSGKVEKSVKNKLTHRVHWLNVFDIFYGDESERSIKFNNFTARIADLIREVPNKTITIGLRKKQEQQRATINIAVDIYRALDPEEKDMQLQRSIIMRAKERENNEQGQGLDALADLIIVKKKLSIPLSQYTFENSTIEDIYDLLSH